MKPFKFLILISLSLIFFSCDSIPDDEGSGGSGGEANVEGSIKISDCSQSGDVIWTDHNDGVDYVIDCRFSMDFGSLTIEPGVTIFFEASASFEIDRGAYLIASGTATNPITFSSEVKSAGYWNGIAIESDDVRNTLSHVIIEYAGANPVSSTWYPYEASIVLLNTTVDTKASVNNCTIKDCTGAGLVVQNDSNLISCDGNTITNCSGNAIRIGAGNAHVISQNNIMEDNGFDWVSIRGSTLNRPGETSWLENRYHIDGRIKINSGLSIAAGSVFEMEPSSEIDVDNGYLKAIGTDAKKIHFRGVVNNVPSWKRILFSLQNDDVRNELSHCIVQDGGSGGSVLCNIFLASSSRAKINNCSILNSGGCGIFAANDTVLTEFNNIYSNNVGDNICD